MYLHWTVTGKSSTLLLKIDIRSPDINWIIDRWRAINRKDVACLRFDTFSQSYKMERVMAAGALPDNVLVRCREALRRCHRLKDDINDPNVSSDANVFFEYRSWRVKSSLDLCASRHTLHWWCFIIMFQVYAFLSQVIINITRTMSSVLLTEHLIFYLIWFLNFSSNNNYLLISLENRDLGVKRILEKEESSFFDHRVSIAIQRGHGASIFGTHPNRFDGPFVFL